MRAVHVAYTLTSRGKNPIFRMKFLQLYLPSGRGNVLFARLSPIWGPADGYTSNHERKPWSAHRVHARWAVDIYIVMPIDLEKYRRHVDRFDLTEAQKAELIHTVWAIMESVVDRAFGSDPVQQCGLVAQRRDSNAQGRVVVSEGETATIEFQSATGGGRKS